MFCKNCGKEVNPSKKFCTNCGTEVARAAAAEPAVTTAAAHPINPAWSTGKVVKTLVAVVIVGGLIALKVVGFADSNAVDSNNTAIDSLDAGNSGQAIAQLENAANSAVTSDTKISTYKNLGYAYSSNGENDKAVEAFKQALALTSEGSFDYHLVAGEIATIEGKPNSAILNYNKAYAISPNDFQINNALALFYLDVEGTSGQYTDYEKALPYAQRAAQLSDLQIADKNLGWAYFYNENYAQAIATLNPITSKDPYTLFILGVSYFANGETDTGVMYLRQAKALGVEMPAEIEAYLAEN